MIIYLITLFLFPMSLILMSFIMNVLFLNQTKIADAFRVVCTETGSFSGCAVRIAFLSQRYGAWCWKHALRAK